MTGLWDSFAEDAFVRDVEAGIYFNPERMYVLDHKGQYLKARGPLNIARPIQGWPVIVQAGASEAGRQLAAETAEVIFASGNSLPEAQRFYADVKGRLKRLGRSPDHLKILPGVLVVVGDTVEKVKRKRALWNLVHPDGGVVSLSIALWCDLSGLDLDGPLPEIPETNDSKSGRERFVSFSVDARTSLLVTRSVSSAASADFRLSERRRRLPIRWRNWLLYRRVRRV